MPVVAPDGRRTHVVQRTNESQAEVVRLIFRMCADGHGLTSIAKHLNATAALSPRAQRGRPNGWAASSVREVLHRSVYKGVLTWNKSRKRDRTGVKRQQDKPASEWLALARPDLAVITDAEWEPAHARIAADRVRFGKPVDAGRSPGHGAKYLLTGLLRCRCGAGIEARTREQGSRRVLWYGCSAFSRKGSSACENSIAIDAATLEQVVIDLVLRELLKKEGLRELVVHFAAGMRGGGSEDELNRLRSELADVNRQLAHLTSAVAAGGELRHSLPGRFRGNLGVLPTSGMTWPSRSQL